MKCCRCKVSVKWMSGNGLMFCIHIMFSTSSHFVHSVNSAIPKLQTYRHSKVSKINQCSYRRPIWYMKDPNKTIIWKYGVQLTIDNVTPVIISSNPVTSSSVDNFNIRDISWHLAELIGGFHPSILSTMCQLPSIIDCGEFRTQKCRKLDMQWINSCVLKNLGDGRHMWHGRQIKHWLSLPGFILSLKGHFYDWNYKNR